MVSVYEKYHLKKVINASGRMTMLGVSTPRKEVIQTIAEGLNEYFEMKDLVNKTGEYIATLLNVENAVIVSCAAAGIVQSIAAMIVKNDKELLYHLHSSHKNIPREIIIPKGHNVNFGAPIGTMIELGGGIVVEAGFANECKSAHIEMVINENTAAIFYVKSHHCVQKSILSYNEAAEIAKKYNIPLIIDAAAEEEFLPYYHSGAELVIFSGAKAIEGPTSGLVIGQTQAVEWVKLQSDGIGRSMKIGKEGILGFTKAIDLYINSPRKESGNEMINKMSSFIEKLNQIKGVSACVIWDAAGRDIARTEITFDEKIVGKNAVEITKLMKKGETAVYFREYKANEGKIEADVRSVSPHQLEEIYQKIKSIIEGKSL